MGNLMNFHSMNAKLSLAGIAVVAVTALTILGLSLWIQSTFSAEASALADSLGDEVVDRIASGAYHLVDSQNSALQLLLRTNAATGMHLAQEAGGFSLGDDRVTWKATNQLSGETTFVDLPVMKVGRQNILPVSDPKQPAELVDRVTALGGGTSTLFQVMNDEGDLLRVATTVINKEGKRAIGTYIPAINPDGKPNPVAAAIQQGRRYEGVAFVVDSWYLTLYDPILDQDGKVIGVFYVGIKQETVSGLRDGIIQAKTGEFGESFVLSAHPSDRGKYLISSDPAKNGQSALELTDADGNLITETMIQAAEQLGPGERTSIHFTQMRGGEPQLQMVRLAYYAPWKWVIAVKVDEGEMFAGAAAMEASRQRNLAIFIGLTLVMLAFSALIFSFIARGLSRPINAAAHAAESIAQGRLSTTFAYQGQDEIGRLSRAFQTMTDYLQEMAVAARRLAEGDLTIRVQPRSSEDQLGSAFETMIAGLRMHTARLKTGAQQLASAAESLDLAAKQNEHTARQIAAGIQQVTQGSVQQTNEMSRTSQSVNGLTRSIENISSGSQHQAEAVNESVNFAHRISSAAEEVNQNALRGREDATQAAGKAEQGKRTVEENISGMRQIQQRVALAAESVRRMGERSAQIGGILETIEDIASQTNLLALNAAIEAARAGESGRGFAVVAEEVRKLAERAGTATGEIGKLIGDVQATARDAVAAMENGAREVDAGMRHADASGAALDEIQIAAAAVNRQVDAIATSAQEMLGIASAMVGRIETVSAVIEENIASTLEMNGMAASVSQSVEAVATVSAENSAAAEEIHASVDEMNEQIRDLSSAAAQLRTLARTLNTEVDRFTLEENTGESNPAALNFQDEWSILKA